MAVPNGWEEQPPVEGDPKKYYEAKIGNYIGTNGQSISIFARTDTAGNYQLYQTTPTSLFGSRELIYTYNQTDSKNGNRGLLSTKDFNNINTSVKQKSYEINQAVGSEGEKEALNNSKGYKSLAQSEPEPTDNPIGQSDDDTSNGGLPKSPATFGITTNEFEKKKGEEYNNNYLIYPKNISEYQDRITIVQRQYVSPDVLTNKNFDVSKVDNFGKERFYDDRFIKNLGTVTLPMPNDISETNISAWGEDNLSSLAALVGGTALGVAKGVSEFDTEKIQNAIKDAAGEIFNGPGGETIKQLLALNAAAQISQKFGININPEAFRSRITGTAINQNLELLFQGPKLRSFGFQFKMTPRSEDEAKNIRNILKFFKKGMSSQKAGCVMKIIFMLIQQVDLLWLS